MNIKYRFLFLIVYCISFQVFANSKVMILPIDGPIGPATQDYIERGLEDAMKQKSQAVIIQLNTPGGLETSMRGINKAIMSSSIPVIAYVYPSGARASSAGLFIMYAAHFNAMATGTNIGAASPVNLVSRDVSVTDNADKDENMLNKKMISDASAYIRSLAELRGHSIIFGEQAVREAISFSASEALKHGVINLIADNYDELLQKINGKNIKINEKVITLQTNDWQLEVTPQDWRFKFLSFITDPNIAYILMLMAIYGIFFELYNPGLILPGVVGVISLIISLYAFQLLPVNYTGIFLILLGIIFLITEIHVTSYGVIGAGGVIAFIIGSIMLFNINDAYFHLSWSIILLMSIITIGFILVIIALSVQALRRKIVSGKEALIGAEGLIVDVKDNEFSVLVLGEIWHATSSFLSIKKDDKVRICQVKGLLLVIEPLDINSINKDKEK